MANNDDLATNVESGGLAGSRTVVEEVLVFSLFLFC